MADQPPPTPAVESPHRRWFDLRATLNVLRMPEIGLLVLTFFLATFAFANFEGTLSLLNEALGLGRLQNFFVFAGVGLSLIVCQGFIYRRLAKLWPERRFVLVGLLCMAAGLAGIGGVGAFATGAVPSAKHSVLTGFMIGVLFSTFSAMQFIFAPIWGRISDRVGRRPILLLGLAGSVVFYALFGAGTELGMRGWPLAGLILLFLSRAGQGIAGATIATAQAVIADTTSPGERSRGMALIGAAFGIGFTVGPAVGALMVYLFPNVLGSPCFAAAALSLVALLIGWRQLPETLPSKAEGATPESGKAALRIVFLVVVIDLLGFGLVLPLLPRIGENFIEPVLSGAPVASAVQSSEVAEAPPPPSQWPSLPVWVVFQIALFVAVLGFAFLTPSIQALISKRTDPLRQGEVLGVNQSASALARILGPVIGTVLLKVGPLPFWPYAVAAGLLLLLFVPATRIRA